MYNTSSQQRVNTGGKGIYLFTSTHGCIQSTPTMVNTLIMKNLLFDSVSENEMLDKIISQNNYCDINSLPASNNDILTLCDY